MLASQGRAIQSLARKSKAFTLNNIRTSTYSTIVLAVERVGADAVDWRDAYIGTLFHIAQLQLHSLQHRS